MPTIPTIPELQAMFEGQGRDARAFGAEIEDCPYHENSLAWRSWRRGWSEGKLTN